MTAPRALASTSASQPVGAARHITDLGDGRSIAWAQDGAGRDLLAIHGTLMTLDDMWLGPMPALARHFRVTAVDRPGHGLSRRHRLTDASPLRQAEIIHDAARAIGLEKPIVCGHSFGGAVALAYAQLYPDEVAGVVALAPICFPEPRLEQMIFGPRAVPGVGVALSRAAGAIADPMLLPLLRRAIFLPQALPTAFAEHFPVALTDSRAAMIVEGEDALMAPTALMRMMFGYVRCRVPTRFLVGTADAVVNNAVQGLLAAAAMPRGSVQTLAGLGHMIHHHAIPAVVAAALDVAEAA